MMQQSKLSDVRVLVLEDDYYLAMDLCDALQAAGAIVVGPFADTASARRALVADQPDCALVDLNLGEGIDLGLPRRLTELSVPFAFVTGYDRAAIPDEFAGRPRAEKPVVVGQAVELVGRLLARQRR